MSQLDIKGLKREWKNDPCWTLCETPGYEKHYDELKAYQEKCVKEWDEQITKEMNSLGITNKETYFRFCRMQEQVKELKEVIKAMQVDLV